MALEKSDFAYRPVYSSDPSLHFNSFRTFLERKYRTLYPSGKLNDWKDIAKVEAKHIAEYIDASLSKPARDFYASQFGAEVAPRDLIIKDFSLMAKEKYMFVRKREKYDISARAIQGHAHEGHGAFHHTRDTGSDYIGRPARKIRKNENRSKNDISDMLAKEKDDFLMTREKFANTTTLDVIAALETSKKFTVSKRPAFNVEEFQDRTQNWIDDIVSVFEDFFANPAKYKDPVKLEGKNGKYFARLGWMEGQPVNMIEVIRGFYFASQMDNFDLRQQIQSNHDKQSILLGGGTCLAADMDVLKSFPGTLADYAHAKYPNELAPLNYTPPKLREKVLTELGIVVSPLVEMSSVGEKEWIWNNLKYIANDMRQSSGKLRNTYVRSMKGCGVADDVAIILASVLPQTFTQEWHKHGPYDAISRVVGATIADLVDTLEKDSNLIFSGGQDDAIGTYLSVRFDQACRVRDFRDMFNVHKHRSSERKYQLIKDEVIKDFVAASANWPFTIHSSQRYFHKDVGGTCAISEYLKFLSNAFVNYGLEAEPSIHTPNEGYKTHATLTFERIPVPKIIHELGKRFSLVRNPESRERKVHDFFSKMTDMHLGGQ